MRRGGRVRIRKGELYRGGAGEGWREPCGALSAVGFDKSPPTTSADPSHMGDSLLQREGCGKGCGRRGTVQGGEAWIDKGGFTFGCPALYWIPDDGMRVARGRRSGWVRRVRFASYGV